MDSQTPTPSNPSDEDVKSDAVVNDKSSVDSDAGEAPTQPTVSGNPTLTMAEQPVPGAYTTPSEVNNQQPASGAMGGDTAGSGKGKKRWVLPAAIVGILAVLLAGGYVFAFYLPNQPGAVYGTSLKRSGEAVDALVNYSTSVANKDYKAYSVNGKMHLKSSGMSMDATLDGSLDKDANGMLALNADIMGQKMALNLRSVHASGNTSPDLYLRVSGVKSLLNTLGASGMNSLGTLDNQWIVVDHTLMDTLSSQAGGSASLATAKAPTSAQIQDAMQKVQTVNKQYFFTTDSSKAVLKQSKYIGKETKDGRSVYHYKVGYDKSHLQDYVNAVGKALDSSKLNDWSKAANGENLSKTIDIDSVKASVKEAKADYTFDMWADTKTKLIHALQFTDTSDSSSIFTVAQNYTGGDDYPFQLSTSGQTDGQSENVTLKLDINKKTDKATGEVSLNAGDVSGSFTFGVTPSNKSVDVSAPSGAIPVTDAINRLGFGDALTGLETLDGTSVNNDMIAL